MDQLVFSKGREDGVCLHLGHLHLLNQNKQSSISDFFKPRPPLQKATPIAPNNLINRARSRSSLCQSSDDYLCAAQVSAAVPISSHNKSWPTRKMEGAVLRATTGGMTGGRHKSNASGTTWRCRICEIRSEDMILNISFTLSTSRRISIGRWIQEVLASQAA